MLRTRRRLGWWLGDARQSSRLLVAASLLLEGWAKAGVAQAFSGGQFAAEPLSGAENAVLSRIAGHTLNHPTMPEAVRLEVPDWPRCLGWRRASAPA